MSKPVVLTGLRTNAEYHLGNYLGAILPMVQIQNKRIGEYQVNMFAPDLHSFTTPVEHKSLYKQTMHNLAVFVAAGMPIKNNDFYLYRQSYVPAHSELTVILNNFVYFGELARMTQFREKSYQIAGKKDDGQTTLSDLAMHVHSSNSGAYVGLFDYPVLMAADILLYDATYVPVGDDQKQHLELTRDIGARLNGKFGKLFELPAPWKDQLSFSGRNDGVRIRSLRNPLRKMSKSVDDPSGTILLSDSPDEAAKKIKTAETDNVGVINWDWENQPGITNLLQINELLSAASHDEIMSKWTGKSSYGELKDATSKIVSDFLGDFQTKFSQVEEDKLIAKLEQSEVEMNKKANETLRRVQIALGLRPR